MKYILLVGVKREAFVTNRFVTELEKNKQPHLFIRWSSLLFKDSEIYSGKKKLDFKKISAVIFSVPGYNLAIDKSASVKMTFTLTDALFFLLKKLKESQIPAINRDFLLDYPYYNKFVQSQIFQSKKISAIPTVHLSDNKPDKVIEALRKFSFHFPIVAKQSQGGMGENVWKIKDSSELTSFLEDRRNDNLVFQPYIKNDGDFRILVIGGKSLGIMKRSARKGEWKNNFALGGSVAPYRDKKMERFSEAACRKMGLDYAGVDVIVDHGKYRVIEINVFAVFAGFEKVYPEINVPQQILSFLKNR
jgi:RimK family alpha-L-glutamate ligase